MNRHMKAFLCLAIIVGLSGCGKAAEGFPVSGTPQPEASAAPSSSEAAASTSSSQALSSPAPVRYEMKDLIRKEDGVYLLDGTKLDPEAVSFNGQGIAVLPNGAVLYNPNHMPGTHVSEMRYGEPIEAEETVSFLEISYRLSPWKNLQKVSVMTEVFDLRKNALPYGLNQFCPTAAYVCPTDGEGVGFIEVHVREKDGAVGESFAPLSTLLWDFSRRRAEDTMTTEAYHDADEFFERNFGAAEAGDDPEFPSFTRMEDVELGGVPARHYSYRRAAIEDVPKETGRAEEKYGEQYLFETEEYLYLFTLSSWGEDEELQSVFHQLVDSVEVSAGSRTQLPVWKDDPRLSELHLFEEELTGEIPDCLRPYLQEKN